LALARPQLLRQYRLIKESGVELIIAIDVSRSMEARDMEDVEVANMDVTRLHAARSVIREFVRRRPLDRIGLVAFAGRPYLASPLTLDHDWLQQSLARVRIGLVEDGTAIGSAIAAGAKRLDRREAKSKLLVLLTDGANNAGRLAPLTAAELSAALGVKIYAIAVGTPKNQMLSIKGKQQEIAQEFDMETLQAVARASGGEAFLAKDTENLEKIFSYIDSLEATEREVRMRVEPTDLFVPLIALMTMLALVRLIANQTLLREVP
ncbi:MAG: VWA domain-containing protein, partial [Verrucomicrobiota bacterium]